MSGRLAPENYTPPLPTKGEMGSANFMASSSPISLIQPPLRAKASDQVKDPHQGRIGHLSDRGKPSKGRTDRTSDPKGAINSGSLELAEEFPPP
jgi:hypothetical protein